MVNAILGGEWEVIRRIQALEANVRALATQPLLLNASTGQDGGQGLSTSINGLHLFNPAGVEVVTLSTIDGSATLGNTTINGNLSVPNGSITNAALQNPIVTGSVGTSQSNFLIDGTHRLYATSNITVPAGYTNATVLCMATVYGYNGTASADFLTVQAYGGNGAGGAAPQPAAASGGSSATAGNAINTFTGLSGGTIQVGAYVYTSLGGNWGTNSSNICNVNAFVIFTR